MATDIIFPKIAFPMTAGILTEGLCETPAAGQPRRTPATGEIG